MKLKQIPSDFRVEELTNLSPGETGPFAFYLLDKINWTTPDALNLVRKRWKVPFTRLAFGGLKDRHASTSQFVSIFRGPQRNFTHPGVSLIYKGQIELPFSSADIKANRFSLTLRSMSEAAVVQARSSLPELARVGVPNYFDDQRFGSVAHENQFVAKEMVLGRYEQALKLALASPYEHDRAAMKDEKAILKAHWGNWSACKDALPRGHARLLVDYLLHHPDDYRGALGRLKPELRGLYLSAWQSHLWNKILALWIRENVSAEKILTMKMRLGPVPIPRSMPEATLREWKSLSLPLPSSRLKVDPDAPWAGLVEAVMEDAGLALSEMKLRDFRKPFFSKGDRAAAVIPEGLSVDSEKDDLHPGKRKLILRFDLPRGCYATMIVKRLTQMRE
jgi:tRNA pseudouridine13 synthase